MISQYGGLCVDCDDRIEPGEEIHRVDGSWVHVECPIIERRLSTQYCNRCFTFEALDGSCNCS